MNWYRIFWHFRYGRCSQILQRIRHDVTYIKDIYYILHDMDYYLLRYAPDDVASFVQVKAESRFITELYRYMGKKSQKEEAYGTFEVDVA